jgi:hypothetical protein
MKQTLFGFIRGITYDNKERKYKFTLLIFVELPIWEFDLEQLEWLAKVWNFNWHREFHIEYPNPDDF